MSKVKNATVQYVLLVNDAWIVHIMKHEQTSDGVNYKFYYLTKSMLSHSSVGGLDVSLVQKTSNYTLLSYLLPLLLIYSKNLTLSQHKKPSIMIFRSSVS